ncbi:MAG: hypothetical protein WC504_01925 [Methylobacter sp.]
MNKYTIQAKKNAIEEWEISGLSEKQATKQAKEEAEANPDLQIFVVFSGGYLNVDGHSPVGKAW